MTPRSRHLVTNRDKLAHPLRSVTMSERTASETATRLARRRAASRRAAAAATLGDRASRTGSSLRPKLLLMAADALAVVTFTTLAAVLVDAWNLGPLDAAHQLWWSSVLDHPGLAGHLRQPAALQHPLHRPPHRRVPPDRQRLASSAR